MTRYWRFTPRGVDFGCFNVGESWGTISPKVILVMFLFYLPLYTYFTQFVLHRKSVYDTWYVILNKKTFLSASFSSFYQPEKTTDVFVKLTVLFQNITCFNTKKSIVDVVVKLTISNNDVFWRFSQIDFLCWLGIF